MRAALLLTLLAGCAVPPEAPSARVALLEGPWPRILPVADLSAAPVPRLDAASEAALRTAPPGCGPARNPCPGR